MSSVKVSVICSFIVCLILNFEDWVQVCTLGPYILICHIKGSALNHHVMGDGEGLCLFVCFVFFKKNHQDISRPGWVKMKTQVILINNQMA